MDSQIEIVGVYPIRVDNTVHLIELILHNLNGPIDMADITQEKPGWSRDYWQVPYEERILDSSGNTIVANPWFDNRLDIWIGDIRMAFFFHDLDLSHPLLTPFGPVMLPEPSILPLRLKNMTYEPVD